MKILDAFVSFVKLWHITSGELHDIALASRLIIDEGVPRGTAIDNGHLQGQHLRQSAWRFVGCSMLCLKWGYPSWMVYFMANPIN